MAVRVQWTEHTGERASRRLVDPCARQDWKDVTLAWLRRHAPNRHYRVRWWEGPSEHEGTWHDKEFAEGETTLRDVKTFAATIAATVTQWEVEITLRARTHGQLGWDYGTVWTFGHYMRESDQ